jgi:hypothetical protein
MGLFSHGSGDDGEGGGDHAAPCTGIKSEWTWEEEDTHAENIAEDSLHDSIGI